MPYIVIAALVVIALVILFIIKEVNITIREYKNLNNSQPFADEKIEISKDISHGPLIEGPKEQLDNKSQVTGNAGDLDHLRPGNLDH